MAMAIAAAMLVACTHAAASDYTCQPSGPPKGTVLAFPAGAFYLPDPVRAAQLCRYYAAAGYVGVAGNYPLLDVGAAVRYGRDLARRSRRNGAPLFAVGESAGGTIALDLAVAGEVDAAVAVAAPSNLLTWSPGNSAYWHGALHIDRSARRQLSPYYRPMRRPSPMLLFHSPEDSAVPYSQSRAFARRAPRTSLCRLRGSHLQDRSWQPLSLRWLGGRRDRAPRRLSSKPRARGFDIL